MEEELEFHTWQDVQQIGPFTVRTTPMVHPVPAYAIRVEHGNKSLVYTGDTGPNDGLIELARGADLLLSEAALRDNEPNNPVDLHLTPADAGEHAKRAGVKRLVITHVPPWFDRETQAEERPPHLPGEVQIAYPASRLRHLMTRRLSDGVRLRTDHRYCGRRRRRWCSCTADRGCGTTCRRLAEMLDDGRGASLRPARVWRVGSVRRADVRGSQDDIEELRAHWGHEQIVVIGHSFGATLAMTYAAAYPDSVAAGRATSTGSASATGVRRTTRSRRAPDDAGAGGRDWRTVRQASARPEEETEFRALSWFTDHADREHAWSGRSRSGVPSSPINFAANRALSARRTPDIRRAGRTGGRDRRSGLVRPRRRRPSPGQRSTGSGEARPEPRVPPDRRRRPLALAGAAGAVREVLRGAVR